MQFIDKKKVERMDSHIGSLDWKMDMHRAARPPHVEKMSLTNGAGILVAAHRSKLSWQISLDENSAAWARLIIEGLIAKDDAGFFIRKIPMTSYLVAKSPKCPKPDFMGLTSVVEIEANAEAIVNAAISRMKMS